MNNIISKVLAELSKGDINTIKLDYIRGMLETYLEMQEPILGISSVVEQRIVNPQVVGPNPTFPAEQQDEGAILDAITRARVGTISKLAQETTENA